MRKTKIIQFEHKQFLDRRAIWAAWVMETEQARGYQGSDSVLGLPEPRPGSHEISERWLPHL